MYSKARIIDTYFAFDITQLSIFVANANYLKTPFLKQDPNLVPLYLVDSVSTAKLISTNYLIYFLFFL